MVATKSKGKGKAVCDTCGRSLRAAMQCVLCGVKLRRMEEIFLTPAGFPYCADEHICVRAQRKLKGFAMRRVDEEPVLIDSQSILEELTQEVSWAGPLKDPYDPFSRLESEGDKGPDDAK